MTTFTVANYPHAKWDNEMEMWDLGTVGETVGRFDAAYPAEARKIATERFGACAPYVTPSLPVVCAWQTKTGVVAVQVAK